LLCKLGIALAWCVFLSCSHDLSNYYFTPQFSQSIKSPEALYIRWFMVVCAGLLIYFPKKKKQKTPHGTVSKIETVQVSD
jgi:hypothetical protein